MYIPVQKSLEHDRTNKNTTIYDDMPISTPIFPIIFLSCSHAFTWFSAAVGFFAFLASGSVAFSAAAALRLPAAFGSVSRPRLGRYGDTLDGAVGKKLGKISENLVKMCKSVLKTK